MSRPPQGVPSQINRVPFGLQDLLNSRNFGRNPNALLQEVRPGFDMLPFWGLDSIEASSDSAAVSTFGTHTQITVPDSELWLVLGSSVNCTNNFAASALWFGDIRVQVPSSAGGFSTVALASGPDNGNVLVPAGGSTGISRQIVYNSPYLWPAKAGTIFSARITALDLAGGATVNFAQTVHYIKLAT